MERIWSHLILLALQLGFLSKLNSVTCQVSTVTVQNSTFSTFTSPPDVTSIILTPNETWTMSYIIRYREGSNEYFVHYKFNGTVVHPKSNYEDPQEENYFTSMYTNCCSQPGEKCRELQLTVNGVENIHGGIINLVAFQLDPFTEVESSDDIHIEIIDSSINPRGTTPMPTPTQSGAISLVKSISSSGGHSLTDPNVLPLCSRSPGVMKNPVRINEAEWPQYLVAGSLLGALITVTTVLIATYLLLIKESSGFKQGKPQESVNSKNKLQQGNTHTELQNAQDIHTTDQETTN